MRALTPWMFVAALAFGATACKKDAPPAAPAAPAAETAEAEAAEGTPEAGTPTGDEEGAQAGAEAARPTTPREPGIKVLSIDEHMEAVSKQITSDNYKDELARLEEQINRRADRPARPTEPTAPGAEQAAPPTEPPAP